jgi:cell division septum initiation protein DivIVA
MVKYFSEILKTITPTQRLLALCILILAVVIITVGPKFIDSVTKDTEELKTKITAQRTEINDLTLRVNELNKQLLANQSECTNSLIAKEREILDIVVEIERQALNNRRAAYASARQIRRIESDSSGNVLASSEPPVAEVPNIDKAMMRKIKDLKSKLQTDLNKK